MLRYFSYGHAAKIFLIEYKVLQASQKKKQQTIPAEVLPNDSEALFIVSPKIHPFSAFFILYPINFTHLIFTLFSQPGGGGGFGDKNVLQIS